ncbi:Rieske (2Fe-2S) protein [Sandaracinobacteroides saxicola]|uniref:Rieske (2Fe-2S) protein n=1 Tax=Sandaracinobacteroides saxicola TaxID=2759707 RepID=A0A7G5IEY0_9SPHN|nr:Rieske (2Fe-2S) protein [Sandaracinobacteroides saxicola]QMW21922.1 Rieske (2Fe-2S) protein [Sandaracinobacteroides saxicola]
MTDYVAAGAADLPPGSSACRTVAGRALIVARAQDGTYHAVANRCSHAALPLDGGRVRGSSIVCPHHGARFDLKSGRVLGPPAHEGIVAYPTRERDGVVEVWLL